MSWRWVAAADVGHLPDHEMTEAKHGGTAALAQHSHLSEGGPGVTLMHESPELKVVLVRPRSWAIPAGSPGTLGVVPLPDGGGVMVVGTEEVDAAAGATVVVPTGVSQGSGRRPGWCS